MWLHRWTTTSFLPIREGVSLLKEKILKQEWFPPYTGGCIGTMDFNSCVRRVSSLYGRVYRHSGSWTQSGNGFLPIREGVSELRI